MKEAVSIVVVRHGNVYYGMRLKAGANYGRFAFPGGKREYFDPSPEWSARRELKEEMAIQVPQLIPLAEMRLTNQDFGPYLAHGFLAFLPSGIEPQNAEPTKHRGWFQAPIARILEFPDEKLLPGTKEYLLQAAHHLTAQTIRHRIHNGRA